MMIVYTVPVFDAPIEGWFRRDVGLEGNGRVLEFPPGSPDLTCLYYSVWDRLQKTIDSEKFQREFDRAVMHLKFVFSLYEIQINDREVFPA